MIYRWLCLGALAANLASCADADSSKRNSAQASQQVAQPTTQNPFRWFYFQQTGSCADASVAFRFLKGERRTKPFGGTENITEFTLALFENGIFRARYFEKEHLPMTSRERTVLRELVGRFSLMGDRLWLEEIGVAAPVRDGGKLRLKIRFAKNLGALELEGEVLALDVRSSGESPFNELDSCEKNGRCVTTQRFCPRLITQRLCPLSVPL